MQYPNLSADTEDCAKRLEVQEAIIGFTVGLAWRTDGVWRSARSELVSGLSNLREPPPPPCPGRGKWNSDFNLSRGERLQGDRVRMRREGEGRLKDLLEKYKCLWDCLGKWRPSLWLADDCSHSAVSTPLPFFHPFSASISFIFSHNCHMVQSRQGYPFLSPVR